MPPAEWDQSALVEEEIKRLGKKLAEENKRIAHIRAKLNTARSEQDELNEFHNATVMAIKTYKEAPVVKLEAYRDTLSALKKIQHVSEKIQYTITYLDENLDDALTHASVVESEIERLERERAVECKILQFPKPDGK